MADVDITSAIQGRAGGVRRVGREGVGEGLPRRSDPDFQRRAGAADRNLPAGALRRSVRPGCRDAEDQDARVPAPPLAAEPERHVLRARAARAPPAPPAVGSPTSSEDGPSVAHRLRPL
jgi:hypothetical protein